MREKNWLKQAVTCPKCGHRIALEQYGPFTPRTRRGEDGTTWAEITVTCTCGEQFPHTGPVS